MSKPEDARGHATWTVEWFDLERGVGSIRPDDGSAACGVDAEALRACGLSTLGPGDRVRFITEGDEAGGRSAVDLSLVNAVQRWENEGGALPTRPPNG